MEALFITRPFSRETITKTSRYPINSYTHGRRLLSSLVCKFKKRLKYKETNTTIEYKILSDSNELLFHVSLTYIPCVINGVVRFWSKWDWQHMKVFKDIKGEKVKVSEEDNCYKFFNI